MPYSRHKQGFPAAPTHLRRPAGMPTSPLSPDPRISLVIPIRNEAGNIGPLIGELASVLDAAGYSWELLVIDDGSTDGSAAEVTATAAADSRINYLPLETGRGKSAALAFGFPRTRGGAVVMLDGDGQDDPAEIPGMLRRLGLGPAGEPAPAAEADLVNGWKTPRLDPWHKTLPSRVFNLLVSWLTGLSLHDHNCGLKAMRRGVAESLPLTTGMHRFIPVLAAAAGSRVVEQPVHHRPRTLGVSKYGFTRFFHGLLDLGRVWLAIQTGRLGQPDTRPPATNTSAGLRWMVYGLLAALALGGVLGRIGTVASVDRLALRKRLIDEAVKRRLARQDASSSAVDPAALRRELTETITTEKRLIRPFLSGNDRSRWLTIRSLVERGSFAIEDLVVEPGWDTIDAVVHPGGDGQLHLYSSKPPLLPVLLAGPYWLMRQLTGWTLGDHPFELGRLLLVFYGLLPLAVTMLASFCCIDRVGRTDGGRLWAAAVIAGGTLLNTFAVVLNNHLFAAACAAVSLWALVTILLDGRRTGGWFLTAGMAAGLAAAFELPALAWTAAVVGMLAACDLRRTLLAAVPAVAVVAAAAIGTNVAAHGTPWPAYAFRGPAQVAAAAAPPTAESPADEPHEWNPANWYDYRYTLPNGRVIESYWRNPQGIDRGEPSLAIYAFHSLIGHHGIVSLTPAWLAVLPGLVLLRRRAGPGWQLLAVAIGLVSLVVIAFYLTRQPLDRNYGGTASGFRWVFWLAPLWAVVATPAADRLAASRGGIALLLILLTLSAVSVAAPTWNPWTLPWLQQWLTHLGWLVSG